MSRSLIWILACCGLLPACQSASTPTQSTVLPLAGQTVEIIAPADLALREHWEPLLQEWRAQTGGVVTWLEYEREHPPWGSLERSPPLPSPLPRGGGEGTKQDAPNGGRLILVPLAELADAEAAGMLTPFPVAVAEKVDGKDIFPGLKDAALSRQKKLIAAPVSAPVLLCYYRKDLLDAAGLTPPKTWDDYEELVEQLPQWAPGLTALEPCGPEFRAALFLARSAAFAKHPQNYSVWFDFQTGEPLFDSPAFERSLDTARKAWSKMPAEIWQDTPSDCRSALLAGKAAMVLAWEPAAGYPRKTSAGGETASETAEPLAIGVVPLPGTHEVYQNAARRWEKIGAETAYQPGFVGFTGLVMGVSAENERAGAWNLLQTLTAHQDQAFAERPRSVCRESEAIAAPPESAELSAETASQIVDATAETLRRKDVVFDLAIPQAQAVRQIIAEELETAKEDLRPTAEILAAMQRRISEATQDRREQVRDMVRRSAGLGPGK
jgi:ABC-type glycerol-3-phosphate transport system substrate-binding protein